LQVANNLILVIIN